MSIPLDEANRIKNELDQVFDGQNVTISIVQPLGETAVVIEAPPTQWQSNSSHYPRQ